MAVSFVEYHHRPRRFETSHLIVFDQSSLPSPHSSRAWSACAVVSVLRLIQPWQPASTSQKHVELVVAAALISSSQSVLAESFSSERQSARASTALPYDESCSRFLNAFPSCFWMSSAVLPPVALLFACERQK